MKKNTKKYAYVVNLSEVDTLDEIDVTFALAKHNNGLAITDEELTDIVLHAVRNNIFVKMFEGLAKFSEVLNSIPLKRDPWYKRAWNAITTPVRKAWKWIKNKFKK